MPKVDASGVQVNFPFEPYPCQVDYMSSVVTTLKKAQNAILESPTGTGKTLCLLCSSLAWLEVKKAQIQSQRWKLVQENADDGGEGRLDSGKRDLAGQLNDAAGVWDGELAPPKIIYASRTHSQLTQVIQELKRSSYSHFKVSVLGSREQMCIHPQVMKEETNMVKVHMCRSKVSSRTCHFYNNVDNSKHSFTNQLMDIEDLVVQGKKMNCCPYYVARELKQDADIIFLPYNYLLDPKSRRAHGVELQGNVVIFDEAHNLEQICEETSSFDFTSTDVTSAMREVDSVASRLQELCLDENLASAFGTNSDQGPPDLEMQDVLKVKMMLINLEAAIDKIPLSNPKDGVTKPGCYIFELLANSLITFDTKTEVLELLGKLVVHLSAEGGSATTFNSRGNAVSKFADMIKIIFSQEPASERTDMAKHKEMAAQTYRVHIRQTPVDNFKSKSSGWGSNPSSNKTGRTLSYWCFSPSRTMLDLISRGVKSIILTSGTLSPMASFKSEMGIDFQVELENPHVIDPKQVWVGTLAKGPDNEPLCSDYRTRFKESYQKSLGNAVVNFSRVVPHGLLIFFPSYTVMDKCVSFWQSGNLWSRMDQMKALYVEPRNKHEFNTTMNAYYDKINDDTCNGATFAAVCRGKVSEGLDFADRNGRAVVITGLPFPPMMDPKVMLKMKFLDESRKLGGKGLTGQEWYGQQAARAVNQAIGRVIRHKEDFGAIILCDRRFADSRAIKQLPSWVRPRCQMYSQFGVAIRDMIAFFREAEQMMPQPQPSKRRETSASCEGAHFQPSFTSLHELKKSSSVLSEVPSLRKKDMAAASSSSLKELSVHYDASYATTSLSKGGSLLNALTSSEIHCNPLDLDEKAKVEPLVQRSNDAAQKSKRKILIKGTKQSTDVTREGLQSAEQYLAKVKKTLSGDSYKQFGQAMRNYKANKDYDCMVAVLADLFTDNPANYPLFRAFYRFVRDQHKMKFNDLAASLTGERCEEERTNKRKSDAKDAETDKRLRNSENDPRPSASIPPSCSASGAERLSSPQREKAEEERFAKSKFVRETKHLISANSGHVCCKCLSPAIAPCKASCGHIACLKCWKQSISEEHVCPECGEVAKFRQLQRLYFQSGPSPQKKKKEATPP